MKRHLILCFVTLLAVGGLRTTGQCQDPASTGQLWYVWEIQLEPPMHETFLELSAELPNVCQDNNFPFTFYVWATDNMHYLWYYPIQDIKETEQINQAWARLGGAWGQEKVVSFFDCIEFHFERVMLGRKDLSYMPANSRISDPEIGFAYQQYFYVEDARQFAFEGVLKEYVAFLADQAYGDKMEVSTGIFGYENPCYIAFTYARNALDFWQQEESFRTAHPEELYNYNVKTFEYLRKTENRVLWLVKPFCYIK